jgi:signal transduction histidine kinase
MKPRLLFIFTLIVIVPLAVLGWLGAKLVRDEQAVLEHRFSLLMESQLHGVDGEIANVLERWQRELRPELESLPSTPAEMREQARRSPIVSQYFRLDSDQRLVYPNPLDEPSPEERSFLSRTAEIWDRQALTTDLPPEAQPQTAPPQMIKGFSQKIAPPSERAEGWYAWFWGDGTHLIYWLRDDSGGYAGAELSVARLKSDIVVALPDTPAGATPLDDVRMAMLDAKGAPIYQWGAHEPTEGERPRTTLALSYPLGGWSLAYFASPALTEAGLSRGLWFNVGSALAAVAFAVVGLAIYFYRENLREMREAAQRVSFVNQVSHELKTPLTNIRMYAEMLDQEIGESEEKPRRHLDIIISESQRLSRLIGNVLTFSRKERHTLRLRLVQGYVDDVLKAVLDHYRPALEAKGIVTTFVPGASECVLVDADVVEQIIGNLVSNVEKYGADGKELDVVSRQDSDIVTIDVSDAGPGIPKSEESRIFEPFYRVSDRLSDGVTGTGIGLAIARELARLHGGELDLVPAATGATFRVTLRCPRAVEGDFR